MVSDCQLVLAVAIKTEHDAHSPTPGPRLILVLEGLVREVLAPRTSIELI